MEPFTGISLGSADGFLSDLADGVSNVANFVGDTFFGGSHSTNEANMAMNAENIAFQREENAIARYREDHAVQRAAADMTAAGLSKTLAAGNPASAQSMNAPNNSFAMEKNIAGMNAYKMMSELYFDAQANKRANDLNDAQVKNIEAQTAGQNLSNDTFMENFQNEQIVKNAQAFQFRTQGFLNQNNAKIAGITSKYTAQKIESEINLNVVSALQKRADVLKTKADITKIGKEIKMMSYDVAMKVMQTKGLGLDLFKKKAELKMLVVDRAKVLLENEVLKHNLNYAQKYNYPVGVSPSGLIGSALGVGYSLGSRFKSSGPSFSGDSDYLFDFNGKKYTGPELTYILNGINGFNY